MRYVACDGRSLDTDLCCWCVNLRNPEYSGNCKHYAEDYDGNTCPGFVQVADVQKRTEEILTSRCK